MINPREPALVPLKRISPSRASAFNVCPLRELFRAANAQRLLAAVGAAHLGTVIHGLLERAAMEQFSSGEAERLFDDLVRAEEEKMLSDERARTAVPLARSVRDFEVRKRRALLAALSPSSRPTRAHYAATGLLAGSEVWVQSADGMVGGYIDEVVIRDGIVTVRDFKSGTAIHRDPSSIEAAKEQLMLYAALYAETTGTWPAAAEIVPVAGDPIEIAVTPEACREVLQRSRALMASCNDTVANTPRPQADLQLGRPSPSACRQCDYRVICSAYQGNRNAAGEWPRDVIGIVKSREPLKNGTFLFLVEDDVAGMIAVRGITAEHARLDDIDQLKIGAVAGFFNMSGGRDGSSYAATPMTTAVSFEPAKPT